MYVQVHFTIALQFYVYVNVELFLYVSSRELILNTDMLSSSEARKKGETQSSNNYSERLTERKPVTSIARSERDRWWIISVKSRRSSEAKRNEVDEI